MIPIGELVNAVYASMSQQNVQDALRNLYEILHMTAWKRSGTQIADRATAKSILTERMWMILPMGCQFVLTPGLKLKARLPGLEPDGNGCTALDDILYQAMEDAAYGRENTLRWMKKQGFALERNGTLSINEGFIWGILLALVTCPENKDEWTGNQHLLTTASVMSFVNDLWGREDFVRKVFLMDYGVEL